MLRRASSVTLLALLVMSVAASDAGATAPGENGRILYWEIRNRSLNLFAIAPDGTGKVDVTNLHRPDHAGPASWSPDGSRIVMSGTVGGVNGLFIMNADGSAMTLLQTGGQDPSWSPDGSTIVFEHGFDLWAIGVDGGGPIQLTSGPALDLRPEWSPDGSRIVFDSNRSGSFDVWTMRADGGDLTDLTPDSPAFDAMATWSPDGRRIAFTSDRGVGADFNVEVMDADGSNVRRLTRGVRDDEQPSWSPDGSQIVFLSNRDGDLDVFVIDAQRGGARTKITHTNVFEEAPKWQPL